MIKPADIPTAQDSVLTITQDPDGNITIAWAGTNRTFAPGAIELLIENIEKYQVYPQVWLLGEDTFNQEYAARLENGQFFILAQAKEGATDFASWSKVKTTLNRALKAAKTPA